MGPYFCCGLPLPGCVVYNNLRVPILLFREYAKLFALYIYILT